MDGPRSRGCRPENIVAVVLNITKPTLFGKANAVIADGLGVAGAVGDPTQILKKVKYLMGLQPLQYTLFHFYIPPFQPL